MAQATRTLNPLHFEDLEPHRFEDLIRQLTYDFRDWSALEATGKSGADDGFDVRGRELVRVGDLDADGGQPDATERIWLIQCKREKSIPPLKLANYAKGLLAEQSEKIYGLILAAPSEFSKKARDAFISVIREFHVQEFQLWGRAELEDRLFQPKNDHLLFAYFQISLQVQRRSVRTVLRSRLVTKRKCISVLGGDEFAAQTVLLRNCNDRHYPYMTEVSDFDKHPPWQLFEFTGHYHDGLKFRYRKRFAYLADDHIHFDFAGVLDDARPLDDPWGKTTNNEQSQRAKVNAFWLTIPEANRSVLEVTTLVSYDRIMAVDEDGDEWFDGPHIYVDYATGLDPFAQSHYAILQTCGNPSLEVSVELQHRVEFFPREIRDVSKP